MNYLRIRDIRGASSPRFLNFLVSFLALCIFVTVFSAGHTPLFLASTFLLSLSGAAFIIFYQPRETLSFAKIFSLLYITSFSLAPLWLADTGIYNIPYFGGFHEELLARTAFLALSGYVFYLISYCLFMHANVSRKKDKLYGEIHLSASQRSYVAICSLLFWLIGGVCYAVLIMRSGGLGHFLTFSGSRADIFEGVFGGWFWGMHLLFGAYGLTSLLLIRKRPWFCLTIAIVLAAAFAPLQGRDIVVAPLFCWLLFYHALRRPISWRSVAVGAFVVIALSALIAAFRGGDNLAARKDVGTFMSSFMKNANQHLIEVVSINIEQLDSAMIGVKYVELTGKHLGPGTFAVWLEPVNRLLLGGSIRSVHAGVVMDNLIMPEHKGWNTALSPSNIGELFIGLGWTGLVIGMLLYGLLSGILDLWRQRFGKAPLLFSAYPFFAYVAAKMVVDGSVHLFRPLIVFIAALVLSRFMSRTRTRNHQQQSLP